MELLQIWGNFAALYVANYEHKAPLCDSDLHFDTHNMSAMPVMHWAKGSLGQAYVEKNPLAALQAFAIASGWEQSSFMRRHFLGRALVSTVVHVHFCK